MPSKDLQIFVRQIRQRSRENRAAVELLQLNRIYGNVVSVLRQELDSLVRVIFLLSQPDRAYREELMSASVDGRPWTKKGGKGRITDREMVDLSKDLFYWAKNVYEFGCAYIHLSSFHDYGTRDPMDSISVSERATIAGYLNYYHCVSLSPKAKFAEIVPLLPAVFDKINRNLECYLKELEEGKDLD